MGTVEEHRMYCWREHLIGREIFLWQIFQAGQQNHGCETHLVLAYTQCSKNNSSCLTVVVVVRGKITAAEEEKET
jgi:hypothetical protein